MGEDAGIRVPARQWTTSGAPAREQLGMWQDAVDEAFVPVQVTRRGQGEFVSDVAVWRLGAIEVSDLAAPAQVVQRSAAQVARKVGDVYFLNLPLVAGAVARQSGRSASLTPGDFVVVDGDRPFDLDFATSFRQVSLKIPREVLDARLAAPAEVVGMRVAGDRGIGSVAAAAVRAAAATAASLDGRTARGLGDQLADLVALALGGVRPQLPRTPAHVLLAAAHAEIDRRLADPDLSPVDVAHSVGISLRYLHRLFADQGPSFGRWVQAQRLDRAGAMLADPSAARLSIADVAEACGFADPSYFARVFGARFGDAPRTYRANARDRDTSAR